MKDIVITSGDAVINAQLNDTVAARDFEGRLPFEVDGHDSGVDYCCAAEPGEFDPAELRDGWEDGDIGLANGWFAILYAGQEESAQWKDQMIIGHIPAEELPKVRALPKDAHFKVELA